MKKSDDGGKGSRSPLWVDLLSCKKLNTEEFQPDCGSCVSSNGAYKVIQQLVTQSPNRRLPDSEIETCLEAYVTPQEGCLWRRVSVWGGLTSRRVMHASFILLNHSNAHSDADFPSNETPGGKPLHERPSLLCWASFPDRPKHELLCVLVNPSTLTIWDVYPNASDTGSDKVYSSAEGHSVSLPFMCSTIHPLGESHGILLQRKQDQEDFEARNGGQNRNLDISHPEFEDDFFLKAPPRSTRVAGITPDRNNALFCHQHGGATMATPQTAYTAAPIEVSSLFSLKHPLDDVLPLALWSQNDSRHETLVTDVFEKIVYCSTLRWTDEHDHYSYKREYQQPICVTYNTMLKRYVTVFLLWAKPSGKTKPILGLHVVGTRSGLSKERRHQLLCHRCGRVIAG